MIEGKYNWPEDFDSEFGEKTTLKCSGHHWRFSYDEVRHRWKPWKETRKFAVLECTRCPETAIVECSNPYRFQTYYGNVMGEGLLVTV